MSNGKNRRSTRPLWVAGVLIAVGLLIPTGVWASHQFDDVPDSNVFHDDIDWLADNGITRGCNPPTNNLFCPSEGVTRQQMAAFMKRFHDRFIGGGGGGTLLAVDWSERQQDDPVFSGNGFVTGLSLDLDVPEAGVLIVEASAEVANADEPDSFACGINTGGAQGTAQADSWRNIDLTSDVYGTCSTMTVLPVSSGPRVARVIMSGALSTTVVRGGSIHAVLYTFDDVSPFSNAEEAEEVPAPVLSDTPKGTG